jgi:uncharacterized membrane protein YeaQ/YmgE (transglycosylase-associated protein family)
MALTLGYTVFNVTLLPGSCIGWALAGLIGGWLAGLIVHGKGYGCIGDILLGLAGAFLAAFLLELLPPLRFANNATYHFIGTTVLAFAGALVLALLGRLLSGNTSSKR